MVKIYLNARRKPGRGLVQDGIAVSYAPAKRPFPWLRWCFIVLLMLSPLLYFFYSLASNYVVIDSPAVVALERVAVSMPRSGFIEELSAETAAQVSKNDFMMKVLPETWKNDAQSIELLKTRARNLDNYLKQERKTLVSPAGASAESIQQAARTLDYWRANRLVYENLRKKGAATEAEYWEALERENAAHHALTQLKLASMDVYADIQADPALVLERMQIDREIALLEEKLTGEVVVSPISGRIAEVYANAGQTLPLGATVLEIVNFEKTRILAYVEGRSLNYVYSGSSVNVEFPGGVNVTCRLSGMPFQTGLLPGGMTTAFTTNRAVLVELEPLAVLPSEYLVNGLPVRVYWGIRQPRPLQKLRSGMQTLRNLFS